MSDFKGRHFEGEIVLWAVRWYCRYGVSYRDLEQMMGERGGSVDHSTIHQRFAEETLRRRGVARRRELEVDGVPQLVERGPRHCQRSRFSISGAYL